MDAFNSFPNPKSFSKIVWGFASTAREEKRQALAAGGQWDGRCKSITLPGHNVGIHSYLSTKIADTEDEEVIVKSFKGTGRCQKAMNSDLSNENRRIRDLTPDVTRALDEPGLKKMRMTLGAAFGVANPSVVPALGDQFRCGGVAFFHWGFMTQKTGCRVNFVMRVSKGGVFCNAPK